jgi:non-canonical purine NTP pyrophosphatase (RdgB/HAM1 family)
MTDVILNTRTQLGKCFVITFGHKDRIVSKTFATSFAFGDNTVYNTIKGGYLSIDDEGDNGAESGFAIIVVLENNDNRKARFRTVIALIIDGKVTTFDGIVNGVITEGKRGGEGFGYDPIFMPEGYNKTFAELGTGIKNNISHRAKAVQKLADYLLKR